MASSSSIDDELGVEDKAPTPLLTDVRDGEMKLGDWVSTEDEDPIHFTNYTVSLNNYYILSVECF